MFTNTLNGQRYENPESQTRLAFRGRAPYSNDAPGGVPSKTRSMKRDVFLPSNNNFSGLIFIFMNRNESVNS
jgi:hypothetical protein